MEDNVQQFKAARQRASETAADFLAANPKCAGVVVVSGGVAVHRDKSGNERLVLNQKTGDSHEH